MKKINKKERERKRIWRMKSWRRHALSSIVFEFLLKLRYESNDLEILKK
jgi:hypothetical protein